MSKNSNFTVIHFQDVNILFRFFVIPQLTSRTCACVEIKRNQNKSMLF